MMHINFEAEPTSGVGRIRVKIETNVREVQSFGGYVTRPYAVESPWWSGAGDVVTFSVEELMGTKLRALYQRRKGRDVFDLWLVLTTLDPDDALIIESFRHYIGDDIFSFAELAINLSEKLRNREFREDLLQLSVNPSAAYDIDDAANVVMERIGARLGGAPAIAEIREGAWRR